MFSSRKQLYQELEKKRNSKLLVYVTGDRPGLETQIHSEAVDWFTQHLDSFVTGTTFPSKISLWLYSRGGQTLAGWCIVNLIRQFCKEFEVIVFSKAQSTASLICLGADNVLMTKQATLGPIDPSVNSPLNPQLPGGPAHARVPVSVESVAGYIDLARKECGIKSAKDLAPSFLKLSDFVHPLALGDVFRARTQIQMLAEKLLKKHNKPFSAGIRKKIIKILCSESGSHDYTISRREARDELGLDIEKPDMDLYNLLKKIHDDINNEMELTARYDPGVFLGTQNQAPYVFKRCLIESVDGGSHKFISEGTLQRVQTPQGPGFHDQRTFEGWRKDGA